MKISHLMIPLVFITNYADCQDVQLNFNARILILNCEINTDSQYQAINLGDIKKQFFTAVGTRSEPVIFGIEINCVANSSPLVSFTGKADPNNSELLALDDATENYRGIGIRLMSSSGQDVSINGSPVRFSYSYGVHTMQFKASYESTLPQSEIKAGPVVATMMFTINYQ